jgi:hypothetical protein
MLSITNTEVEASDKRLSLKRSGFLFFGGVLLPAISFLVEITTGINAETFFDPMPSWWHVLLVVFVPITNFQTLRAIEKGRTTRLGWLGFANALTIFISLYYSIIYAPLLPLAFLALIFFLVGLLPMTPFFALVSALMMRRDLRRLAPERKTLSLRWQGLAIVFAAIVIAIGLIELPFALTRMGIQMASSENPEKQAEGLRFLQRYGSREYLLRKCYSSSGVAATEFISHFLLTGSFSQFSDERIVQPEKAREIFYRLHGKPYNSVAAPRGVRDFERESNAVGFSDEPDAAAGGINQGLSLSGSTIDGTVDGDAALGYLEWTIVFKNDESWQQQEALANIQLPPGAVVSRLTLWINGEEREAAFAGRERVTAAYNAVTARRRDPVLVTTAGKDRISVRAFPVPPKGEIKTRIGITVPLVLENESSGLLKLPYFNERNFSIKAEHSIWIESKKPLEAANPAFTIERKNDLSAVRGRVKNADLVKIAAPVRTFKSADIKTVWTPFNAASKEIVRQEIVEKAAAKPAQLIFVADTSARMKDFKTEVAAAIKTLPAEMPAALVLTNGNGLNLEAAAPISFSGNPAEIAARIEAAEFGGGSDSMSALETAYDLTDRLENSRIVWLHAPQPMKLSSGEALKQRFRRRPASSLVYSLQTTNGTNAVEKELDGYGNIQTINRFGNLGDDLTKFLAHLTNAQSTLTAVRTIEKADVLKNAAGTKETSKHLARLWASDEVTRLLHNNEDTAALELAVKNQLVTPVSGAVVLETKEQYDQFGLKPVDANTVPTIPEPEEYLLFAIVLAVLTWFGYKKLKFRMKNAEGKA